MEQDEKLNQDPAEIMIDGRVLHDDDVIHELVEVVEEGVSSARTGDVVAGEELRREVARVAELVAREMFPGIAERVIREEIRKLKESVTQ